MAITKTTTVQHIRVFPAVSPEGGAEAGNLAWPSVLVVYNESFDDPDDLELPVEQTRSKTLTKFESDGTTATNVSSEDQLVQDICTAIWS